MFEWNLNALLIYLQRQPSRGILKKSYSVNMQQIYRRALIPKCDFNKAELHFNEISLRHGCSSVNLLHIFRILFPKNTSGRLLLHVVLYNELLSHFAITDAIHNKFL